MSLQCFYQLGVITYFHLNREYIAEVLCINKEKPITLCHGQCFLDRNLDLADELPSDEGTVPTGKQSIDFPVFLISENSYQFSHVLRSLDLNTSYFPASSTEHSSFPFHPPAVPA
jgi:hypothetical protein